jgi:hypothetical protein
MWGVIKGFLAVAGGCFTMLVVLAFLTRESGNTPSAVRQQYASEEPEPVVAAINVSAVALGDAYEANSVAADMRFKGQRLRITGDVHSISTDIFDHAVIELQSSQFLSPQATLADSHKSRAAQIRTGQVVTLLCTGAGDVMKMPMLKDCSFQ